MPALRRATPSMPLSSSLPTAGCRRRPGGSARRTSASTCATLSRPRRPTVSAGDAEEQDGASGRPLTAGDLMDADRAAAWLADAAAGKTRTRSTSRGPDAAAYPNSMRVRIDSVNAFAEFIGEPARLDRQPPARGFQLDPGRHRGAAARPDRQAADPRQRDDGAAHRRRRGARRRHRPRRAGAGGPQRQRAAPGRRRAARRRRRGVRSRSPRRRCTSSPAGSPPAPRSSPSSRAATRATCGSPPSRAGPGAASRRPSRASAPPRSAPCTPRTAPWSASCSAPRCAPARCAPPRRRTRWPRRTRHGS